MKKILFLLLASINTLNAMEEQPKEPIAREIEQTFEQSVQLPEEVKQQILLFVPTAGNYQDLVRLISTNQEFERFVKDKHFLRDFAKRTFEANPDRAKQILKAAASHDNVALTKAFIKADESLQNYADDLLLDAARLDLSKIKQNEREVAQKNNERLVKTLLGAHANPNVMREDKTELGLMVPTALLSAIYRGNKDIAKLLVAYRANVNRRGSLGAPLDWASDTNQADMVKLLLEHGADANSQDERFGSPPLLEAIRGKNKEMAQLLLDHGADPNLLSTYILTHPLIAAMRTRDPEIIQMLIDHKTNINYQDPIFGDTPLMWASMWGAKDIVKQLLDNHVDIRITNYKGKTALDIAQKELSVAAGRKIKQKRQDILELLEKAQKGQTSGQ